MIPEFKDFIRQHETNPEVWLRTIAIYMEPSDFNANPKTWEQVMSNVESAVFFNDPSDVSTTISGLNMHRFAMEEASKGLFGSKNMRSKAEVLSSLLQVMGSAARGEYHYRLRY